MNRPDKRPRPLTRSERDLVSRVFGYRGWREMAAALTTPQSRHPAAPDITESTRTVVGARLFPRTARRRPWAVAAQTRLPSARAIIAACQDVIVPVGDPEILHVVRDLAVLAQQEHHPDAQELVSPTQVAFQHDQLIATLERLTTRAVPARWRRGVVVHTESLTAVIDRLVTFTVTRQVIDVYPVTPESHQLDIALTDLIAGYDELVTDLATGRRRLPRYQSVPAT